MEPINHNVLEFGFQRVSGQAFERFVNSFLADVLGYSFVPLGGMNDGGADGFMEVNGKPDVFVQTTVQEDHKTKIKKTIERLRAVGRDPKILHYLTTRAIERIDVDEQELEEKHDVRIRIKDLTYLLAHTNRSDAAISAFTSYIAPNVQPVVDYFKTPFLKMTDEMSSPAIYAFLEQELEARNNRGVAESLMDGLIIWALRDTNPETDQLMTSEQICERVEADAPNVFKTLRTSIGDRLHALSRKSAVEHRAIRFYGKKNKFCLAFDLRKKLAGDLIESEALKVKVFQTYGERVKSRVPEADDLLLEQVANTSYDAIQLCLEKEGIEFASFLRQSGEVSADPPVRYIENKALELDCNRSRIKEVIALSSHVLGEAFSKPTEEERILYSRIASTYTVLFTLRCDANVIKYFDQMAGHFRLFVGADVIVQALGERFLPAEEQDFCNTLSLVVKAGGKLILAEPVLDEIMAHIHASRCEFENKYQDNEEMVTPELFEELNRPLIKAYFRGRFYAEKKDKPNNWPHFLGNLCDPYRTQSPKTLFELKKYLMRHFQMSFESREDIVALCSGRNVKQLEQALIPFKKEKQLAVNDALMAHLVYATRTKDNEQDDLTSFGLRTWWLTNETSIVPLSRPLMVAEHSAYLMRPDYLLHFITFLPRKRESEGLYKKLFPSLLGVHLARAEEPSQVKALHVFLDEISKIDPARRTVLIAERTDRMKGDLRAPSWIVGRAVLGEAESASRDQLTGEIITEETA